VGSNNDEIRSSTGKPMMPRLLRFSSLERRIERIVLSRASVVIGANSDNLKWAVQSGAPLDRSVLVRYGNLIDPEHFSEPSSRESAGQLLLEHGVPFQVPILLYVGRLEAVKRPHDVLEVALRLHSQGLDFACVMVGEGSQRIELEREASRMGIEGKVFLPGNLDQRALVQLYAAASCVVSPHTGRALAEAALGGAAIAAYDVDWQSELVIDGETGRLVAAGDVEGLSACSWQLITRPEYARALGSAARRRALELLSPQVGNDVERGIYQGLLGVSQT